MKMSSYDCCWITLSSNAMYYIPHPLPTPQPSQYCAGNAVTEPETTPAAVLSRAWLICASSLASQLSFWTIPHVSCFSIGSQCYFGRVATPPPLHTHTHWHAHRHCHTVRQDYTHPKHVDQKRQPHTHTHTHTHTQSCRDDGDRIGKKCQFKGRLEEEFPGCTEKWEVQRVNDGENAESNVPYKGR